MGYHSALCEYRSGKKIQDPVNEIGVKMVYCPPVDLLHKHWKQKWSIRVEARTARRSSRRQHENTMRDHRVEVLKIPHDDAEHLGFQKKRTPDGRKMERQFYMFGQNNRDSSQSSSMWNPKMCRADRANANDLA